jgi:hypothetical protein
MRLEVHLSPQLGYDNQILRLEKEAKDLGYALRRSSSQIIGFEQKLVVGKGSLYLAVSAEIYKPEPDKPVDSGIRRMGS